MTPLSFSKKQIAPKERVCLRLKSVRESAGKTLENMCEETKLSTNTIEALESCSFHSLPFSVMYKKQCIRRYCKAIKVSADPFILQFEQEEIDKGVEHFPLIPKKQWVDRLHLRNIPLFLRTILTGASLSLLVAYIGVQAHDIMTPPKLIIASPNNGLLLNASSIVVRGEAEKDTVVLVNGKITDFTENGGFEETIDLLPGLNTIVISAEKKHGKNTEVVRYVVRKTEPHVSVK